MLSRDPYSRPNAMELVSFVEKQLISKQLQNMPRFCPLEITEEEPLPYQVKLEPIKKNAGTGTHSGGFAMKNRKSVD
jgi:hypothetical protein